MTPAERVAQMEKEPKTAAILKDNSLTARDYLVGVPALRMALMGAQALTMVRTSRIRRRTSRSPRKQANLENTQNPKWTPSTAAAAAESGRGKHAPQIFHVRGCRPLLGLSVPPLSAEVVRIEVQSRGDFVGGRPSARPGRTRRSPERSSSPSIPVFPGEQDRDRTSTRRRATPPGRSSSRRTST